MTLSHPGMIKSQPKLHINVNVVRDIIKVLEAMLDGIGVLPKAGDELPSILGSHLKYQGPLPL